MSLERIIPASDEVRGYGLRRFDELEFENKYLRSAWVSIEKRFAHMRDARGNWAIAGFAIGVVVAISLDGTVAQNLDRLLTWFGWVA